MALTRTLTKRIKRSLTISDKVAQSGGSSLKNKISLPLELESYSPTMSDASSSSSATTTPKSSTSASPASSTDSGYFTPRPRRDSLASSCYSLMLVDTNPTLQDKVEPEIVTQGGGTKMIPAEVYIESLEKDLWW